MHITLPTGGISAFVNKIRIKKKCVAMYCRVHTSCIKDNDTCLQDGGWSPWSSWSSCSPRQVYQHQQTPLSYQGKTTIMPKCPSDVNPRVLISISPVAPSCTQVLISLSPGALTTAAAPAQTHIHHLAAPIAEVATRLEEE